VLHVAAPQDKGSEDHLKPSKSFGATKEITMTVAFILLPVLSMIAVDWALSLMQAK